MESWKIYYNPKCGTCRSALALLEERGIKPTVIEYLKHPLGIRELRALADAAGGAKAILRMKEEEAQLQKLDQKDDETILQSIAIHPILLQRPIVVKGSKALVARPAERVEELF